MATTLRFTEDFSGSGDLNGSTVGATSATWQSVSGAWSRSGGLAKTTAAVTANPILATNLNEGDADITLDTYTGAAGGDALYFRVSDAQNWWRLRQRVSTSSSSVFVGYVGTGWVQISSTPNTSGVQGTYYSSYSNGVPTGMTVYGVNIVSYSQGVVAQYSTQTTTNRYLVLDKMVAGVLTTVESWGVSSFAHLRVVAAGSSIQYFQPDAVTVHATVTDTFNQTATLHGLGLGGSDNSATGSALDNWVGQLNGSAAPPSIVSPISGSDVEYVTGAAVQIKSNYPPGDPVTSIDVRWRAQGATAWTETDGALTADGPWTFPLSGLTVPVQIEIQARSTDSFSTVSDWSSSTFFTFRTRPAAPSFTAPAAGGLVTALQVAIVQPDPTMTMLQVRRVADSGSGPDETTIYQDNLELDAVGDGTYRAVGDGVTHTTGTEYVEARQQTTAGGTSWSSWVSLLVQMQVAQPNVPIVDFVPLAQDGSIQFTLTGQPEDPLHKATSSIEVQRDGVLVFSAGADQPIQWTDQFAGAASDYVFTAVANDGTKAVVD